MKTLLLVLSLLTVSACTSAPPTLKSPCVGIERSPCVRTPINEAMV